MGTVRKRINPAVLPDTDRRRTIPAPSALEVERGLFISQKRSKDDFVLLRVLSSFSNSIIYFVAIEGRKIPLELRYVDNAYEVELVKRSRKLCSEGLFVDMEIVSAQEYRQSERIALRHLKGIIKRKQNR